MTAQIMIVVCRWLSARRGFILFGWLSDKIGRKPIILAGCLLAAVTYFPIFKGMTHFANPELESGARRRTSTVIADPVRVLASSSRPIGTDEVHNAVATYAKAALVNAVGDLIQPGDAPEGTPASASRSANRP